MVTASAPMSAPALAVLGDDGHVQRGTGAFLRHAEASALLDERPAEVEQVLRGEVGHAVVQRAGVTLTVEAVQDAAGTRHALLTLTGYEQDADAPAHPVLAEDLDASPAVVFVKDLEGRYLRINAMHGTMIGGGEAQLLGHTDHELEPRVTVDGPRLAERTESGEEPSQLEYIVPAFQQRPALTVLRFVLHDPQGAPVAVCGVASPLDQSHVARAEAERLLTLERVAHLEPGEARVELMLEWELTPVLVGASPESPREGSVELEHGRDASESWRAEGHEQGEHARAQLEHARAEADQARVEVDQAREVSQRAQVEVDVIRAESQQAQAEGREARAQADHLHSELELVRTEIEHVRAVARREHDDAESARAAAQAARTEAAQALVKIEQLEAGAGALSSRLEQAQADAQAWRSRVEQAEADTHTWRTRLDEAQIDLGAWRSRAEQAESKLAGHERRGESADGAETAALADLRHRLAAAEQERSAAEQERRAAVAQASELREALSGERGRAEELRRSLTEAHQRLAELGGALEGERTRQGLEVERLRGELEEQRRGAAAEVEAARAEAEAARAEVEVARGEVEAARAEAEAARAEAVAARVEVEAAQVEVEAAQVEVEAARAEAQAAREGIVAARTEVPAPTPAPEPLDVRTKPANEGETESQDATSPSPTGLRWTSAAARELGLCLGDAEDVRAGLNRAAAILGTHGGWDLVAAWLPDRRGVLRCAAAWNGARLGRPPGMHAGQALPATLGDALYARDAVLVRAGAQADAGVARFADALSDESDTALVIPVRNGVARLGLLQLVAASSVPPDRELVDALEGVALQLGQFIALSRAEGH